MSIFVDPSKRFNIEILFDELLSPSNDVIGYKINLNGSCKAVCEAKGRNFAEMSAIIEEATIINAVTGNPLLRTSVLCKLVIASFFSTIKVIKKVEEENEEGEVVIVDNEEVFYPDKNNVGQMRYELVKALTKKWLETTGGK
jgi:hypothetical protein